MKYKNGLLALLFLLSVACSSQKYTVYSKSIQPGWHKIDLGAFEVETPDDYKYKPLQGIDSYVGIISNGKTTFEFDYGWYSSRHPLTPEEFFEQNLSRLYFNALSDSLRTYNNGLAVDHSTLLNLNIKEVVDEGSGHFSALIEFEGQEIAFRFAPNNTDWETDYQNFAFVLEKDEHYYTKLFYPKRMGTESKSGVYIEDLKSREEDEFGSNKLSFVTFDIKEDNQNEVLQILKSIQLK